ncbi:hypothetical protein ABID42_004088 [Arcicella rosea]|uniref:hypothetical protein n=1 Tax=Arcicella rosea TaxID=502909 RepID=UPI00345D5282
MDKIFDSLSNRETALAIWILIALTACMFSKSIRQSFVGIIKALFAWKILVSILTFFAYTVLWIFLLHKFGFWDISFLKDTVIWALSFGFISLMNVNKVYDSKYFKIVLLDTIKWTIIIEFIVNFFTFSLTTELIFVPILVFSAMMQAAASFKSEHKQVEKLFKYVLTAFGIAIFTFSLYKTFEKHSQLFTIDNLKSFLLPVFLSITFLPFMYLYNLLVKYEELWIRLNLSIRNKKDRQRVKKQILLVANFNIDKLVSISKNIAKPINVYNDFSDEMVKTISKGKYVGSDE